MRIEAQFRQILFLKLFLFLCVSRTTLASDRLNSGASSHSAFAAANRKLFLKASLCAFIQMERENRSRFAKFDSRGEDVDGDPPPRSVSFLQSFFRLQDFRSLIEKQRANITRERRNLLLPFHRQKPGICPIHSNSKMDSPSTPRTG